MRFLTYILFAFGFLDLFAVAMIIPVVSRQATNLGGSPGVIGLVGTIYGTLQLISGPLMGRWSDVAGRRQILLLCLFFTSLGYVFMGFSNSIVYYLLARIPLGVFKHSVSITKAILAETTPKEQRAKVFGYFNGISSSGFIVGPLVGGHLAEMENGFFKVAMASSVIFAFCFVVVLLFMKDMDHHSSAIPTSKSVQDFARDEYNFDFRSSFRTFRDIIRSGPELFLIRFLQGFSATLFRSNFILAVEQRFDTTPVMNGRIISFGSLASVGCALGVGRMVHLYGNVPRLYLHSSILRIVSLLALIFAPDIPTFLGFYFLLSMGSSVARVCSTNLSIERGKVEDAGALLGLNQSVMAVCRTVSPLIAGVSQEISFAGPGVLSVIASVISTALIMKTDLEEQTEEDKKER